MSKHCGRPVVSFPWGVNHYYTLLLSCLGLFVLVNLQQMNVSKWALEEKKRQAGKWKSRWTKELKKKRKMRTDREEKCIFSQSPSFPQNLRGSHLLHLLPLGSRCNPSVHASGVISISEFLLLPVLSLQNGKSGTAAEPTVPHSTSSKLPSFHSPPALHPAVARL